MLTEEHKESSGLRMSTPKDTLSCLLTLVQLIPPYPRSVSTIRLFEKLQDHGHQVDARTVQRDLERLTRTFQLICNEDSKPYQWSLNYSLSIKQCM